MRKLVNLLFFVPIAIVIIVLSVANRQFVSFNLNPFNPQDSSLSIQLPFFVYLFLVFGLGLLLGGMITWFKQGKNRKALRVANNEAKTLKAEKETQKKSSSPAPEIAPGLPMIGASQD